MTRNQCRDVRRLPVVFMIEASDALNGTCGVALRQGLETIAETLANEPSTRRAVYLAAIVFNQSVMASQHLMRVSEYSPPIWAPAGTMELGSALNELATLLRFGTIRGDGLHPGDLPALVFFVLGSHAGDDWRPHLTRARGEPAMRDASVFALIADRREVEQARAMTSQVIVLDGRSARGGAAPTSAEQASRITMFFDWVAQVARVIVVVAQQGSGRIVLPTLPAGLVAV